jgi:5-methylthioadenosine/S-adenosylhomocysteine deaminase
VLEFHDIVREHQMTPVEVLDRISMLRPTLNIGHGNLITDNPNLNYSGARDLELMGRHHCSISHCPINIARRGRTLDDWHRYRQSGVNISIGSHTYPRDMIMNMRTASLTGKIMGHDYLKAPAGEVFEAATVGGARALGRDDLGRLAPGALADEPLPKCHLMAKSSSVAWEALDPTRELTRRFIRALLLCSTLITYIQGGRPCISLRRVQPLAQSW